MFYSEEYKNIYWVVFWGILRASTSLSLRGIVGNIVNLQETSDSEIQELFQLMDVNKDQKLAPKELDCILRALGINATEADLIEFIGECKCYHDN